MNAMREIKNQIASIERAERESAILAAGGIDAYRAQQAKMLTDHKAKADAIRTAKEAKAAELTKSGMSDLAAMAEAGLL